MLLLQTSQQAKAILKQMEDGKLLRGQDYSISALVSLRQTCSESGVSVKAQTSSGRDAIFRAAVEAAVGVATEGSHRQLGGFSPPRFVSGIARDLGAYCIPVSDFSTAEPCCFCTLKPAVFKANWVATEGSRRQLGKISPPQICVWHCTRCSCALHDLLHHHQQLCYCQCCFLCCFCLMTLAALHEV